MDSYLSITPRLCFYYGRTMTFESLIVKPDLL
jgi:hypothetical protein